MKEATTMGSSTSCSWPERRQALRIVVCMTLVLLLISIHLGCSSCDSVWLSFNILGSRPFFLLAPELPVDAQQSDHEEERPTANFPKAPSPSSPSVHVTSSISSREKIESLNRPSLAPAPADDDAVDERGHEDDEEDNTLEFRSTQVAPSNGTLLDSSKTTEANEGDSGERNSSGSAPLSQYPDDTNSTRVDLKRAHPNSRKLEQDLLAAKLAIDGATLEDADETLYGLLYNNVSAFSKSYRLMEELFRVYVYKDGNSSLVRTGPLTGIYASEGQFIGKMIGSRFDEDGPDKAHMFFLPYSVAEMVLSLYVPGSRDMSPLNNFIRDYVNDLAQNYPFWNRTGGADHFFVSCHDWGPATARDHEQLRTNAVKVVCNANLSEEFILGKDASLPEIYLHNLKPPKVGGPPASKRVFLAFFAGQMHGHVRPVLIRHWKNRDPSMKIYEQLPPRNISGQMSYIQHMKNSKYCICPAGFEVNSPRIVEAIYYDCVPVIIADNFVLPFSDVLNWTAFSVTIRESDIPNLKDVLLSIPDKRYRSMQRRLSKIRKHFLWNHLPLKYDVFHMILYSVWTSRLNNIHL